MRSQKHLLAPLPYLSFPSSWLWWSSLPGFSLDQRKTWFPIACFWILCKWKNFIILICNYIEHAVVLFSLPKWVDDKQNSAESKPEAPVCVKIIDSHKLIACQSHWHWLNVQDLCLNQLWDCCYGPRITDSINLQLESTLLAF